MELGLYLSLYLINVYILYVAIVKCLIPFLEQKTENSGDVIVVFHYQIRLDPEYRIGKIIRVTSTALGGINHKCIPDLQYPCLLTDIKNVNVPFRSF